MPNYQISSDIIRDATLWDGAKFILCIYFTWLKNMLDPALPVDEHVNVYLLSIIIYCLYSLKKTTISE